MLEPQTTYYKTPLGTAKIVGDENGIQSVSVLDDDPLSEFILSEDERLEVTNSEIPEYLQECVAQLEQYFSGERSNFDLKLNPQGTDFQKKVWDELLNIPFNKTRTYLEQSKALGDVKAIRAVASANGKNPIWIIIPCHRVIGSDGSLTGYAGGIWRKKWLLAHENPVKQQSLF
ncbi:methylated-DNA--[protein]-cysteine S-methyltransferase [Polaribacter sp. Z014]|uniref:methylated-DNA--[protein]-cysteine S-methyltransferase n=1 Tax=unclassified Polaribacter TaxID=196858 RepID=UPI00193B36A4|nr:MULTISPECIES: methylated-DNA--[protein]-cysteine S-methyltransferase [unclassified Polaribacter]MCL7764807.1 methylated-DNA--[protein]-cysteine S-methyltransferase [Polaribacter sp. Z014]QVY64866.1 methylated-DNA--[protein]-cysteine S-methyltransferase [Polaribacter sp. Q13]